MNPPARKQGTPRQKQLPLPWVYLRPSDDVLFAHPAEAELARLLTFGRVRWLFEPTTFVLERDDDGRVVQAFTPDFYLPEERLYLEVTTMRQSLVTRKNRKLRRLKELYPGVQIKVLYRRDLDRLFADSDETGSDHSSSVEVDQLALSIHEWLTESNIGDQPLVVLRQTMRESKTCRDLIDAIRGSGTVCEHDRLLVTRFRPGVKNRPIRVVRAPAIDLTGRDVLLVTDAIRTGLTLRYVTGWLRRKGARKVEICALTPLFAPTLIDLPIRFQHSSAVEASKLLPMPLPVEPPQLGVAD